MFGPCFLAPVTWLNVLADNQSRAFRGSLEYRAKSENPGISDSDGTFLWNSINIIVGISPKVMINIL